MRVSEYETIYHLSRGMLLVGIKEKMVKSRGPLN